MAKIVVLGAGVMGSAFTMPLADNGHDVSLVGTHLDGDIIEEIHETQVHPTLRTRMPKLVTPYPVAALEAQIHDADLVVLGVNSNGVNWAAQTLSPIMPPNIPIVMVTKGLHGNGLSLSILPEALRNGFPEAYRDRLSINAIGGPSIAGELAARRHTCVQITGKDQPTLDRIAHLMRTPYYHVWTTTDLIGVEVCVAMKNLYALAVGLVIGLLERDGQAENGASMHNLAAGIFAQGLYETAHLVEYMGGELRTVYSLPGAGDLYVTCQGGRNSRMGRLLGLGMSYTEARAKHMPNDSVEGAMLAVAIGPTIEAMVRAGKLDARRIPLLLRMIEIVCHNASTVIPWEAFFGNAP
jgi:glycerol-3-phosphate dehydrogenase (NAD(P)+)